MSAQIKTPDVRRLTLKAVCQNVCGGAFGGHRRVENAVLSVVALLLVVNGHATNAASMHAFPTATALQTPAPLD